MPLGRGPIQPDRLRLLGLIVLLVIVACADSEPSVTSTTQLSTTSTTLLRSTTTTPAPSTTATAPATTTSTVEDSLDEFRVEGGVVFGGSGQLVVDLGSEVRFVVVTDTADHIHVHGYDLFFDTRPGEAVEIEFVADVPGVFEIELEDSGLLLLELEVS